MAIEKAKLDELKQRHGNVWTLTRGPYDFVFRKPTSAEYRKLTMDIAADKSASFDAHEFLVRACAVSPEPPEVEKILEEWPGLVLDLGVELQMIASLNAKTEAKKA